MNPDGSLKNKQFIEAVMHFLVPRNITVGAAQNEYVESMHLKTGQSK